MTVANNENKTVQNGNGILTKFAFKIQVSDKECTDIKVYVTDENGNTRKISSGYLVELNDPENLTAGGYVTYPFPDGETLKNGEKITILREIKVLQELNLQNAGPFMAQNIEDALDKLTMVIQQLNEVSNRTLKSDISVSSGVNYQLPVPVAGKVVGWDATASKFQNYDNPANAQSEAAKSAAAALTSANKSEESATRSEKSAIKAAESELKSKEHAKTIPIYDCCSDADPTTLADFQNKVIGGFRWNDTNSNILKIRNIENTEWINFIDLTTGNIFTKAAAGVTVGAIFYFPATIPPIGYLELNGSLVSRAIYADLWAYAQASGNLAASDSVWQVGQFSSGNGSTTFRIPDLRSEFIRGWDHGRGVDTNRLIGSWQNHEIISHAHNIQGIKVAISGTGWHSGYAWSNSEDWALFVSSSGTIGGYETRPRNITLLPCIKY